MSVITAAGRALAPVERLARVLEDKARRDRAALVLIVAYVLVWTLYGAIAKSSQDINFDTAEVFAWSRVPALGYPKHPPLAAWEAALWFALFPRTDWAFYLLAMTNVGVGFWAAWQIFTRVLEPRRCALALALLSLIPLLNFQALKFTPNVVLIPTWALTTLFLLRSIEMRLPRDAALAGIAAAFAMLGKYWSVYLLIGLAVAAICDPRRRVYFASAAPWITVAAGFAALAPHLAWLLAHGFTPVIYASDSFGAMGFGETARTAATYLLGAAAYVALPILFGLTTLRPMRAAAADALSPAGERRTVAVAFWVPLLLPFFVTLATGGRITPLWTMCNWTLLPAVLLSSPRADAEPRAVARVLAFALLLPLVLLAASPFIALAIHRAGLSHGAAHYRALAAAIERAWSGTTAQPLRIVGGQNDVAHGAAFYLPGPPLVFADMRRFWAPWIDEAALTRDGIALVCPLDSAYCLHDAEAYAGPRGRRTDIELQRRYFGFTGPAERFVIITVAPQP